MLDDAGHDFITMRPALIWLFSNCYITLSATSEKLLLKVTADARQLKHVMPEESKQRFFTIMGDFLGAPPTAAATLPATQRKSASAAARSTRSQRQRANAWASTDADTLDAEARDELWLGEEPNEALAWEKEERGSNHTARRAFHKRSSTAKKSRTRRALRR